MIIKLWEVENPINFYAVHKVGHAVGHESPLDVTTNFLEFCDWYVRERLIPESEKWEVVNDTQRIYRNTENGEFRVAGTVKTINYIFDYDSEVEFKLPLESADSVYNSESDTYVSRWHLLSGEWHDFPTWLINRHFQVCSSCHGMLYFDENTTGPTIERLNEIAKKHAICKARSGVLSRNSGCYWCEETNELMTTGGVNFEKADPAREVVNTTDGPRYVEDAFRSLYYGRWCALDSYDVYTGGGITDCVEAFSELRDNNGERVHWSLTDHCLECGELKVKEKECCKFNPLRVRSWSFKEKVELYKGEPTRFALGFEIEKTEKGHGERGSAREGENLFDIFGDAPLIAKTVTDSTVAVEFGTHIYYTGTSGKKQFEKDCLETKSLLDLDAGFTAGGHVTISDQQGRITAERVQPITGVIYAAFPERLSNEYSKGYSRISEMQGHDAFRFRDWGGVECRLPPAVDSMETLLWRYRFFAKWAKLLGRKELPAPERLPFLFRDLITERDGKEGWEVFRLLSVIFQRDINRRDGEELSFIAKKSFYIAN